MLKRVVTSRISSSANSGESTGSAEAGRVVLPTAVVRWLWRLRSLCGYVAMASVAMALCGSRRLHTNSCTLARFYVVAASDGLFTNHYD